MNVLRSIGWWGFVGLAAVLLALPTGPSSNLLANNAGADVITWTGASSNDWDTSSANWTGDDSVYADGDDVTFDDTGVGGTLDVTTAVAPASITVGGAQNYKFQGSAITGSAGVTMNGTGELRFNNSNSFTGTVTINSGVLMMNSSTSLGSTAGGTIINSGGTINVNGKDIGSGAGDSDVITIKGAGGGSGAMINSSSNEGKLKFLTLGANATVNTGSGNISVKGADGNLATFDAGGFTLTKMGSKRLSFEYINCQNLGDIDVVEGSLSFSRTGFGDDSHIITVRAGAELRSWQNGADITISSNIVSEGGTLHQQGGSNATHTYTGDIELAGNADTVFWVDASSSDPCTTTITGDVTGTQGLIKDGWRTLYLQGDNTYAGDTTIATGAIALEDDATLTSPTISLTNVGDNSRLEVSGLTVGYFTLADGQKIQGIGAVVGNLVAAAGSILQPGLSVGALSIKDGDLTLNNGALLYFELDNPADPATSDQIVMTGTAGALNLDGQEFADFTFTELDNFGEGVYTLIDAGSVSGSLGSSVSGAMGGGGLMGTLSVSGDDLILTVAIPEPSSMMLLIMLTGTAGLLAQPRRRD
ncbi:MAG: autotransporter-associated beta strand repeat-containing protein [Pirellulales bacterium]|nr:autotransporter-associated beta strand repeat-containing protein [Pirellulales bacterium]